MTSASQRRNQLVKKILSISLLLLLCFGVTEAGEKTIDILFATSTTDEAFPGDDDQQPNIGVGMNIPLSERWNVEVNLDRQTLGETDTSHIFAYNVPVSLQFNFLPYNNDFNLYVGGGSGIRLTEGLEEEIQEVTTVTESVTIDNPTHPVDPLTTTVETTSVESKMVNADGTDLLWHVSFGGDWFWNEGKNFGLTWDVRREVPYDEDLEDQARFIYAVGLIVPMGG
jgi:hypothetical protein